jgi:hypothetical protein
MAEKIRWLGSMMSEPPGRGLRNRTQTPPGVYIRDEARPFRLLR